MRPSWAVLAALLLFTIALPADAETDAGIGGHCIDASKSDGGFFFCEAPGATHPSCIKALAYYHRPLPNTPPPPLLPVRFAESALDFLLGLEAYRSLGGVVNSLQRVAVLLNAFISLTPPEQLDMVLHGDELSIDAIRDALQLPADFTLDVNNPPRQLLARLLGFLILPEHLGDSLSTMLLEQPARFGVNSNTTLWFVEAFYNYIWEHTSIEMVQRRVVYRVIPSDHAQHIVTTTDHGSCRIGRSPVRPVTLHGAVFGHYEEAEDGRRLRNIADFFSVQIGVPKGSKEAILAEMRRLAVSVAASALPLVFEASPEAEALGLLSTETAAGAALARTYGGGSGSSFYGDASLAFWLMIGAGALLVLTALSVGAVLAFRARRERQMERTVERVAHQAEDVGRRLGRQEHELQDVTSGLASTQQRVAEVDSTVRALQSAVSQEFVKLYAQMGLRREHVPLAQLQQARGFSGPGGSSEQQGLALSNISSTDYTPAQDWTGRLFSSRDVVAGSGSPHATSGGGFLSGLAGVFGSRGRARPETSGDPDYASIL
eukprot:tig00021319_g20218.t2